MRVADDDLIAAFKLKTFSSNIPNNERIDIINALTCSLNASYLNDLLIGTLKTSGNDVNYTSASDRSMVFLTAVEHGAVGVNATIEFLLNNIDEAAKLFSNSVVGNGFLKIAMYVNGEGLQNQVIRFEVVLTNYISFVHSVNFI